MLQQFGESLGSSACHLLIYFVDSYPMDNYRSIFCINRKENSCCTKFIAFTSIGIELSGLEMSIAFTIIIKIIFNTLHIKYLILEYFFWPFLRLLKIQIR